MGKLNSTLNTHFVERFNNKVVNNTTSQKNSTTTTSNEIEEKNENEKEKEFINKINLLEKDKSILQKRIDNLNEKLTTKISKIKIELEKKHFQKIHTFKKEQEEAGKSIDKLNSLVESLTKTINRTMEENKLLKEKLAQKKHNLFDTLTTARTLTNLEIIFLSTLLELNQETGSEEIVVKSTQFEDKGIASHKIKDVRLGLVNKGFIEAKWKNDPNHPKKSKRFYYRILQ